MFYRFPFFAWLLRNGNEIGGSENKHESRNHESHQRRTMIRYGTILYANWNLLKTWYNTFICTRKVDTHKYRRSMKSSMERITQIYSSTQEKHKNTNKILAIETSLSITHVYQ
jgi:hypothetical protein